MILFYAIGLILAAGLSGWLMTRSGNSYKLGEGLAGLTLMGYVNFAFMYREYGTLLVAVPAILAGLAFLACRFADRRDDGTLQRRRRPTPTAMPVVVRHDCQVLSGYKDKRGNDVPFTN